MKKRLPLLICAAADLALAAYAVVGWRLLRGTGAYRLGTAMGRILSHSWQAAAALAAVLLLGLVLVVLLRRRAKMTKAALPPAGAVVPLADNGAASLTQTDSAAAAKTEKKKRGRREKTQTAPALPDTDKIPPAGPTVPLDAGKIPPAGPTVPLDGDRIPPAGPTVPLDADKIPPAGPTVPLTEATVPLTGDTVPLTDAAASPAPPAAAAHGNAEPNAAWTAALQSALPVCSRCGKTGKPAQRFCVYCGAPMKGESV